MVILEENQGNGSWQKEGMEFSVFSAPGQMCPNLFSRGFTEPGSYKTVFLLDLGIDPAGGVRCCWWICF